MKCIRCRDYSKALKVCKVGKMNPESRNQAIEIATYSDMGKLCRYNKWRDSVKQVLSLKVAGYPENVEP